MTLRVVLADDHPVVRDGLAALLGSVGGIEVVGQAANGREAIRAAVTLHPDVLVLDIQMPDLDGVSAAREIARVAPGVGVLMLTMFDDDENVRFALDAGASGYVVKGAGQDQIVRAIHAVAAGDTILAGPVARRVIDAATGRKPTAPGPLADLSAREREVLDLLAAGLPTAAIAARLGLAAKTVNNHLSSVFSKLGVSGRTEAALLARRCGLGDR